MGNEDYTVSDRHVDYEYYTVSDRHVGCSKCSHKIDDGGRNCSEYARHMRSQHGLESCNRGITYQRRKRKIETPTQYDIPNMFEKYCMDKGITPKNFVFEGDKYLDKRLQHDYEVWCAGVKSLASLLGDKILLK